MSKVILKGYVIVPDSELTAVQNELTTHIELTRQETGCLIFEVSQDEENLNRFNVYEEFTDQNSFADHQDRVSKSKWGVVSANIERNYQITNTD